MLWSYLEKRFHPVKPTSLSHVNLYCLCNYQIQSYSSKHKTYSTWCLNTVICNHSHKKRKDSLEGGLDRVLLAAELEFPKIPRLPQCSLHVASFLEHWYILILLFWYYSVFIYDAWFIYGCSSARTTPGVSLYLNLKPEENIVAVIAQNRVIDNSLKGPIKNQTLRTCRLFALT